MKILLLSVIFTIFYSIFAYFFGSQIINKLSDNQPVETQIKNVTDFSIVLKVVNVVLIVLFVIGVGVVTYMKGKGLWSLIKFGILLGCLSAVNIMLLVELDKSLNSSDNSNAKKSSILLLTDRIQKIGMVVIFLVILLYQFYMCRSSCASSTSSDSTSMLNSLFKTFK